MSYEKVEKLKNKFTEMAKDDKNRRFHSLRDKIYRMDVLECAWQDVKKNKGLDIGYRKLITDSDGKKYGTRMKALTEKATRKQQGSKANKRVREEIKNYIGRIVKRAVSGKSNIAIEDLKNLKQNMRGKWNKAINRKFNYWFYSLTLKRIRERAEVFGVQCHAVPPQYTSQTCPECGHIDKLNRRGEKFKCFRCGFSGDADHIGAMNILRRGFPRSFHDPGVRESWARNCLIQDGESALIKMTEEKE